MPTSSQKTVSVGTGSRNFVSPSPDRTGLVFVPPTTSRYSISQFPVAVDGDGYTFTTVSPPLILIFSEHGDMVRRAWQAISPLGNQNVTYFEMFP